MFVSEADRHALDWPSEVRRQWAIDTVPEKVAPMAVITPERLRDDPDGMTRHSEERFHESWQQPEALNQHRRFPGEAQEVFDEDVMSQEVGGV
jgi:hypothetical protein